LFLLYQQTTPYELVYGQKPRVDIQDLPIPHQTLMDLNEEVELNNLLGVFEEMGMEDVEHEDNESEDYESDNSTESVPGIRRGVTVSAPPSPEVVDPNLEQTVWVSQQGILYLFCNLKYFHNFFVLQFKKFTQFLFCNLKNVINFCFAIYKFTICLFCNLKKFAQFSFCNLQIYYSFVLQSTNDYF
jgi:hypothetical protein